MYAVSPNDCRSCIGPPLLLLVGWNSTSIKASFHPGTADMARFVRALAPRLCT